MEIMVILQRHRLLCIFVTFSTVLCLTNSSTTDLLLKKTDAGGDEHGISSASSRRIRSKRDGSWSEWSIWNACSRTCGGGIRTQTRQCQLRKTRSSSKSSSELIFGGGDQQEKKNEQAILLTRYSRNVSSRHCEGHATRHHLCNTQDCPSDTVDFRESQCSAFDNRPFMGKVYQWESFIDDRSPCSLTCRAKGYRFFATLNKSVIDGTPCTKATQLDLHVCIAGSCTPIGCDGIAGSSRRLDICGVCGGDNSTCRVVSGIFTRPQMSLGYNVVAHIPKGACKLNITEIRGSANKLALRKMDGTYLFNGDYRKPSWPGVYDGAGTKFQYVGGKMVQETISSAGPLRESVELMVLYQQPNPGIKYEYILPLGDHNSAGIIPPAPMPLQQDTAGGRVTLAATSRPGSYVNGPQQFVKSLGGGGAPPQVPTHHHHHNHHGRRRGGHGGGKRDSSAAAAERAAVAGGLAVADGVARSPGKKFYWKITGYTNCSEPCGGGTQRSIIRCVRAPHENPVSDRRCNQEQEKPPGQTVRCNLKPCPAQWIVGEWSNCSAQDCGEGYKTRSIHCEQRISATLTMRVMEGACLQRKPEVRSVCQLRSCHHWAAGEWSECSAKCGNGVRKREIQCVDSKTGIKLGMEICDELKGEKRPAEIKPCNMGPCDMSSDWFVSEWNKECSARCGAGIQTRYVVCSGVNKRRWSKEVLESSSSKELESNAIDDDDDSSTGKKGSLVGVIGEGEDLEEEVYCDQERRPEEERECFSDRMCGEATWFTGAWGDCSVYCGNGMRTRQVLCVIFSRGRFKVVTDNLCPRKSRPVDKEPCESRKVCGARWFTTEWSECSAVCGGGIQKRSVSCRASNWTLPSTLCTDKDRAVERRSCNEHKCSLTSTSTTTTQTPPPPPPVGKRSGGSDNVISKTVVAAANTDPIGMVKDKPLQQQAAGTLLEMVAAPTATTTSTSASLAPRIASSSRNSTNSSNNSSLVDVNNSNYTGSNSSFSSSVSRGGRSSLSLYPPTASNPSMMESQSDDHHELNEEPDESECSDQYRNCALVVQARLCRYKYYRSVCCNSCAEAI